MKLPKPSVKVVFDFATAVSYFKICCWNHEFVKIEELLKSNKWLKNITFEVVLKVQVNLTSFDGMILV